MYGYWPAMCGAQCDNYAQTWIASYIIVWLPDHMTHDKLLLQLATSPDILNFLWTCVQLIYVHIYKHMKKSKMTGHTHAM